MDTVINQCNNNQHLKINADDLSSISQKSLAKPLKILEFYSGIGGMHFAFLKTAQALKIHGLVLDCFDINTNANHVYKENFQKSPKNKNLEGITSAELDSYGADIWLMSPPCQPYTRQGHQKGSQDARSNSFLHIMQNVLPTLAHPPEFILIENVKGFDESDTHDILLQQIADCKYEYQEFLLNPLDFGIPNSRLRYYLLATKLPRMFQSPAYNRQCLNIIPGANNNDPKTQIQNYLQALSESEAQEWVIPDQKVLKYGFLFDIVTPDSERSTCFTKGYCSYVEGTGSVLQTADKNTKGKEGDPNSLLALKLRYFTPREIASLLGFPPEFRLPADLSAKQAYKLLGNSINVTVVSRLLCYLLTDTQ